MSFWSTFIRPCTIHQVNFRYIFFVLGVNYFGYGSSKSPSPAQGDCSQIGGNLASFVSQDDIDRIISVMPDSSWYYWTGLKYTQSSNSWSFIDGTDTTFALSMIGAQSYSSDKCVLIQSSGTFVPTHCTESRQFICQIGQHPIPTDPPSSSG